MEITSALIKELRDRTGGVSVMQCKKALDEAGGDMEKALIIIQRASKSAALKHADRTLGAGAISSYIHSTGAVGAMVILSCETDFVSRNEDFKVLARDIAMHVAASDPQYVKSENVSEIDKKNAESVMKKEIDESSNADKPEEMKAKIMEGKMSSYFKDKVLMEQPFIKNPDVTIGNLIESAIQKFGEKIEISKFVRFSI